LITREPPQPSGLLLIIHIYLRSKHLSGSDGKGKEDRGKGKESAASVKEQDAAWMVMLDESDFEDSNSDSLTSSLSTWPSLDELLEGFTDDDDDNVSIATSGNL